MKPKIEVVVSPKGDISINAIDFKGAECERATRYLEEALGCVTGRNKKPEYYQKQKSNNQQRIGSTGT